MFDENTSFRIISALCVFLLHVFKYNQYLEGLLKKEKEVAVNN